LSNWEQTGEATAGSVKDKTTGEEWYLVRVRAKDESDSMRLSPYENDLPKDEIYRRINDHRQAQIAKNMTAAEKPPTHGTLWECRYAGKNYKPPIILMQYLNDGSAADKIQADKTQSGEKKNAPGATKPAAPKAGAKTAADFKCTEPVTKDNPNPCRPPDQRIYVGSNAAWHGKIVENGSFPAELIGKTNWGTPLIIDIVPYWNQLETAFEQKFGFTFKYASGNRTYAKQVELKGSWSRKRSEPDKEGKTYSLASYAAPPGSSNHGWAVAVDLSMRYKKGVKRYRTTPPKGYTRKNHPFYGKEAYKWLFANAPTYGFHNPPWARQTSPKKPWEPWHWEWKARFADNGKFKKIFKKI
jgi:LAS superfamily LD-carboxypeptidase LdcB